MMVRFFDIGKSEKSENCACFIQCSRGFYEGISCAGARFDFGWTAVVLLPRLAAGERCQERFAGLSDAGVSNHALCCENFSIMS